MKKRARSFFFFLKKKQTKIEEIFPSKTKIIICVNVRVCVCVDYISESFCFWHERRHHEKIWIFFFLNKENVSK